MEAALTLDALVSRFTGGGTAAATGGGHAAIDELATRVRAADILLLATAGSVDAPRRLLEGGQALIASPRVPAMLRISYHRLLGIAHRRRQRYAESRRCLDTARALAAAAAATASASSTTATTSSSDDPAAAAAALVAAIDQEIVRLLFARCVERQFTEVAAVEDLWRATRPTAARLMEGKLSLLLPTETAASTGTDILAQVVCYAVSSAVLGRQEQARAVLGSAANMTNDGAVRVQLALVERCLAGAVGHVPSRELRCPPLPSDDAAVLALLENNKEQNDDDDDGDDDAGTGQQRERRDRDDDTGEGGGERCARRPPRGEDHDDQESSAAASPSPRRARASSLLVESSNVERHSSWLSVGAAMSTYHLVRLCESTALGRRAEAAKRFVVLSTSTDAALKQLSSGGNSGGGGGGGSSTMTAAGNAELRLLVGIKLTAFLELSLADTTAGDWVEAAAKLDALATFMLVFIRHTAHFRLPFHAAAACLCHAIGDHAAADRHTDVLADLLLPQQTVAVTTPVAHGADEDSVGLTAHVLRLALEHQLQGGSGREKPLVADAAALVMVLRAYSAVATQNRAALAIVAPHLETLAAWRRPQGSFTAGGSSSNSKPDSAAGGATVTDRVGLVIELLRGHCQLQGGDWRTAVATLKALASAARDAYGVNSPLVAASLRLLADAHSRSGNSGGSDAAAAMATNVATTVGDVAGVMQCLAWSLTRMSVVTAADADRRRDTHQQLEAQREIYHRDVSAAREAAAVRRVAAFLPDTDDEYRRWVGRVVQEHEAVRQRDVAAAGGAAAKR